MYRRIKIDTNEIVSVLVSQLTCLNPSILIAVCHSLADCGRYDKIPLDDVVLSSVFDKLESFVKSNNDVKVQEAGILAIGHLCLGLSDVKFLKRELDFLFGLSTQFSKNVQVQFSIGDSICAVAAGWSSEQLQSYLDLSDVDESFTATIKVDIFNDTIVKLIGLCRENSSPVVKKAHTVWLLCLVKFCGKNPNFKDKLAIAHQVLYHSANLVQIFCLIAMNSPKMLLQKEWV